MVKIRLQRVGGKKAPFYHIVVADSRRANSGKIIEKIGTFDPMTNPEKTTTTITLPANGAILTIMICVSTAALYPLTAVCG